MLVTIPRAGAAGVQFFDRFCLPSPDGSLVVDSLSIRRAQSNARFLWAAEFAAT